MWAMFMRSVAWTVLGGRNEKVTGILRYRREGAERMGGQQAHPLPAESSTCLSPPLCAHGWLFSMRQSGGVENVCGSVCQEVGSLS
jgi:hypothetical protein